MTRADRRLLLAGAAAGPLFAVVSWSQVATKDGFDITRHALSQLALGPGGWIQSAVFMVAGSMYLAASVGLRRSRPDGALSRWTARLLGLFAVMLVSAGVFPTDPAHGYPVGSTTPAEPSWHGIVHGIAPSTGILVLAVVCVLFAVRLWCDSYRVPAAVSVLVCVQLFVPDVHPGVGNDGYTLALGVTATLGFVWSSLLLAHVAYVTGRAPQRATTAVAEPRRPAASLTMTRTSTGSVPGRSARLG